MDRPSDSWKQGDTSQLDVWNNITSRTGNCARTTPHMGCNEIPLQKIVQAQPYPAPAGASVLPRHVAATMPKATRCKQARTPQSLTSIEATDPRGAVHLAYRPSFLLRIARSPKAMAMSARCGNVTIFFLEAPSQSLAHRYRWGRGSEKWCRSSLECRSNSRGRAISPEVITNRPAQGCQRIPHSTFKSGLIDSSILYQRDRER